MTHMDLETVDMMISMSPNAEMLATDSARLATFFTDALKEEMEESTVNLDLRLIAHNVNSKLLAQYGPLFYMRAIDSDTDEAFTEDSTDVVLLLDTLLPYNNTVH